MNRASVERQVGELLKVHPPQVWMGQGVVLPRVIQAPLAVPCEAVEQLCKNGGYVQHV